MAGARRSAIGGLRGEPPARLVVDGRWPADPVGQSGRRPPVRRSHCRSPCRKNLWAGRPAPAADRAARRPAARQRRHPAGALARVWRGARRACDLRLLAVRLSQWQPRRSDRRRQHRADCAATGAGTARSRDAASHRIIRATFISATPAAERTRHARHCATGRAATGSRLRAAGTIGRSARRVCVVRCVCRTCRRRRAARGRNHCARAIACDRRLCRPAGAAGAPPAAALHLADGSGRPLHARHRRIRGVDRPTHHGRLRPAMARDRRDLWIRSQRPDDAGLCDGRHLERHHAELAGRRRRHVARRTVRPADLRCGAKLHRLSRLRRLPRFRRHRAGRRPTPGGIVWRDSDAARSARCAICRAGQRCIAFIRRIA